MSRAILNRFISHLSDHLLLSLLWLAGCLPVVTAPVATAALCEVARQRAGGTDQALVRAYLDAFRGLLRPALLTGWGWAAVGAVLVADLAIAGQIGRPTGDLLRVALLVLLLCYGLAAVALFPVLVSYHAPPLSLARTSVLVAMLYPAHSLAGLMTVTTAGLVVWTVPVTILVAPSLAAAGLGRIFGHALTQLRERAATAAGPRTGLPAPQLIPLAKETLR